VRDKASKPHALRSEIAVFARIACTASRRAFGLTVFPRHHLERLDVEHRLRQQLLQLRVLTLDLTELASVGRFHPAERATPFIKRRVAKPVLAAQILHRHAALGLLQKSNDLLVCKSTFHVRPLSGKRTLLTFRWH